MKFVDILKTICNILFKMAYMIRMYDMQLLERVKVHDLTLQCPVLNINTYIGLITDFITTVHRKTINYQKKIRLNTYIQIKRTLNIPSF